MERKDLKEFIESQIDLAAKQIATKKKPDLDHIAYGKLGFLLSVRRVLDGTATWEDHGLHDAVNDVLQELGVLKTYETYVKMISK